MTERLLLRPLEPADAEAAHRLYSDADVMTFGSTVSRDLEETRERIARHMAHQREHGFSFFAVELRETGELIGACGLVYAEWRGPDVEVGYRFLPAWWGKGIATEAAAACLAFAFDELGLDHVIAICDPANVASWRVMEKNGMRFDGPARYYNSTWIQYVAERGV